MYTELVLSTCDWNQLIEGIASYNADRGDVSLGVRGAWNFLHAKERFTTHNATPMSCRHLQVVYRWYDRFIDFRDVAITEKGSVCLLYTSDAADERSSV